MRKKILIGVLIIGIGYLGIKIFHFVDGVEEDIPKNKSSKRIESANEQKIDTLNIDNYNVLFFHPNEMEFEELILEYGDENEGLYEVDSDYGFYANKVIDSISNTDLKVKIVTERIIKYSTESGYVYLDRLKNEEHPYGIIFNKMGCQPKIQFGVMTDIDVFHELSEYSIYCK